MKLNLRRRVTTSRGTIAIVMVLFYVLGFGSAMALASVGRAGTLVGAGLIAAALYVGNR